MIPDTTLSPWSDAVTTLSCAPSRSPPAGGRPLCSGWPTTLPKAAASLFQYDGGDSRVIPGEIGAAGPVGLPLHCAGSSRDLDSEQKTPKSQTPEQFGSTASSGADGQGRRRRKKNTVVQGHQRVGARTHGLHESRARRRGRTTGDNRGGRRMVWDGRGGRRTRRGSAPAPASRSSCRAPALTVRGSHAGADLRDGH
jgi:hypothetical protein